MKLLRRRKLTPAGLRLDQLRRARIGAPTLRELQHAATQVLVELNYVGDAHLAQSSHAFTVYPAAQAHFVYACPYGDCDGTYDLNEKVFDMLRTAQCQATGVLHCIGHRLQRGGPGPQCGLGVTYTVTASYGLELPGLPVQPATA